MTTSALFRWMVALLLAGSCAMAAETLYVAGGGGVQTFTTNGVGTVFAPGYTNYSGGMAFDAGGNLYVADTDNNVIVKIATNGAASRFATVSQNVGNVAFDAAESLCSVGYYAPVLKFTAAGAVSVLGSGRVGFAQGMAFDRSGNLYVADYDGSTITRFTPEGVRSIFATTGLNAPFGLAFDSAGNLYAANYNDGTIGKFSQAGSDLGVFAETGGMGLAGLAFDGAGNLYAVNDLTQTLQRITADGTVSTLATLNKAGDVGPEFVAIWPPPAWLVPTNTIVPPVADTNSAVIMASDSIVSLATNVTKNYTFTDSFSGESVTVAVTMTPSSSRGAEPVFTLLDYYGDDGFPGNVAIDSSGIGNGDGNWVDAFEAVNFSAVLVSASGGVVTNTIRFGVAAVGLKVEENFLTWSSSATPVYGFFATTMTTNALDHTTASLGAGGYSGQLRPEDGSLFQLNDLDAIAGKSLVLTATFSTNLPPTLSLPGFANGQFQLTVTGTVGANYIVQAASSLTAPNWTSMATNAAPFVFVDTKTAGVAHKFYRAVAW